MAACAIAPLHSDAASLCSGAVARRGELTSPRECCFRCQRACSRHVLDSQYAGHRLPKAHPPAELNYDLNVHPARILPVDSEDSPDRYRVSIPTDYWYDFTTRPTLNEVRKRMRWQKALEAEEATLYRAERSNREAITKTYIRNHP